MKALVIAAHPDDEVLGPGATIAMLGEQPGTAVTVYILAEGVTLRHAGTALAEARQYAQKAADVLGVTDLRFGGFGADGTLPGDGPQSAVVGAISRLIEDAGPDMILTHHPGDIHVDHRLVADSVIYATRVMSLGPVREVLHFEVLSSTEQQSAPFRQFAPNTYYDVTSFIEKKCAALACYPLELFPFPHPRSVLAVRNLAAVRGAEVGVAHAEAFHCGRQLRGGPRG